MPRQCETAALGGIPGCAALPARGTGFTLAACDCELDHLTHFFGVVRSPLAIVAEQANALLEGWYLGEQGGNAMADVLFGAVNPGGKLPVTIPRSVGQLPMFYDVKPSATPRLFVRHRRAAISIRLWAKLHHV